MRVSAVTTIGAEQMPGGRAQISARTLAGEQQYLTPQLPNYNDALDLLEQFRLFCGGERESNPADEWIAAREAEARAAEEHERLAEEAQQQAQQRATADVEDVWSPPVGAMS